MSEFLNSLFSYMPHGFCLKWDLPLLATMVVGNLTIALAYFAIPIALYYFAGKRKDLPYQYMFYLFAAFIAACGLTHVLKVLTIWQPVYWIEAGLDVVTALLSLATAVLICPLIPKALALKSPAELEIINNKLIESQKLFDNFMQHAPAAAFIRDKDGSFLYANSLCTKSFGARPGQKLADLFPDQSQQLIRSDQTVIELAQTLRTEELLKTIDEPAKDWLTVRFPVADASGNILVGGFAIDITETKQDKARLEQMNLELKKAHDRAIDSSNLKSAFIASMSHELRTPLSGILGMNELLLVTQLSAEQRELAIATQESASSLLSLVEDILDISRIEAGKINIESVPINPYLLLDQPLKVVEPIAKSRKLALKKEIVGELPKNLLGDPTRVHQILLNLIGNAIKFTENGEIKVGVKMLAKNEESVKLRFFVEDTGMGIDEADSGNLFLPFAQGGGSRSRSPGGAGLGLAICKRLLNLMGGEIGFESAVGKGSNFWFTVPFAYDNSAEKALPEEGSPTGTTARGRVLVIEDNKTLQTLVSKQLERLNIEAELVSSAEEGLGRLLNKSYSLILMDCHLPEMSGFEATEIIRSRENGNGARIPIIAMTASVMKGDPEKCLAAGMDDYLSKPYTIGQLKEKLFHWLR
jgi:PAS domain S-box-containing protein